MNRDPKPADFLRLKADEGAEHAFITDRTFFKCMKTLQPGIYQIIDKANRMTDDDLVSGLNTWYTTKNSVVHNSLNKFLLESHQHGIITHMNKKIRGKVQDMYVPEEKRAKVLTMSMLSASFYVWLASIGLACVVFVLEHIHKRVNQQ